MELLQGARGRRRARPELRPLRRVRHQGPDRQVRHERRQPHRVPPRLPDRQRRRLDLLPLGTPGRGQPGEPPGPCGVRVLVRRRAGRLGGVRASRRRGQGSRDDRARRRHAGRDPDPVGRRAGRPGRRRAPWPRVQAPAGEQRRAHPVEGPAELRAVHRACTANHADNAEAAAIGRGGSNNFSNINSTLQAQVFSAAIRDYPSEYVTPGMYRALLEWLTWVQYVGGNNRLPNNNEFFFNWNPATQTFGRSGIHHNILGAYNFMIIDDIAGVRPRLDDVLELWPIDVGWDYFTVNNLSYHGKDLTVVWDRPGVDHYGGAVPDGFSRYLDGPRLFPLHPRPQVTCQVPTADVTVLDDSGAEVVF